MASFAAVLDACVLVPAPLCDLLLRAASAGLYQFYWTDDILEEVRRTLVQDLSKSADQAQRRVDAMKAAFPHALISHHTSLISSMPNDPKDRHVLAAAVASQAQVIVTSNLRHFLRTALAPFGVEAQSPDRFLTHLFDIDPELVASVIVRQARALRQPPMTASDILDSLAKHAPKFASRARSLVKDDQ